MDCAPLNLAHFHERRADKLIKRFRYEEAFKAIQTSLLYVEDAYKHVKIPKGLEVLDTQKWDYERKLKQIQMLKLQYDKMKSKEIVPSTQFDVVGNNVRKEANAQSIARSIDKTIKEFNDKYSSSLMEKKQAMEMVATEKNNFSEQNDKKLSGSQKEARVEHLRSNVRRLSLIDAHLETTDDELPSLAPLELPTFDYNVFGI